jgi:recyclin-1
MTTYKPEESAEGTSNPPLLQYLELVNVVDTVTSILQVYVRMNQHTAPRVIDSLCSDPRQAKYVDRTDFLNAAMQEKKRFEGSLDDAVAAGMNAGVEVLMNQVSRSITVTTKLIFTSGSRLFRSNTSFRLERNLVNIVLRRIRTRN